MDSLGGTFRRISLPQVDAARLASDSKLFGLTWTASVFCLPWQDWYGARRFAVLSPAYEGDVFICRFDPGPERTYQWWSDRFQVGISRVSHWRLASEEEHDHSLGSDCWPADNAAGISLEAQRLHWLFCDGPRRIFD